jgi:signal transduction histidine kinase
MQHAIWAGHDGAPQGIRTIGRTRDGLLYVAAMSGLYTFDGNTFDEVKLNGVEAGLSASVHSLLLTRSGDLFLAVAHGAPVLVRGSKSRRLNSTDCGPIEVISNPQEASDGLVWAILNERKLVTWGTDDVWHQKSDPDGGRGHITYLYTAPNGTVWIVLNDRVYRRPKDGTVFFPTAAFAYGGVHVEAGLNSDLWMASSGLATATTPARHLQHIAADGRIIPTATVDEPLSAAWPVKDGSLWVLTAHSVLVHLPAGELENNRPIQVRHEKNKVMLRTAVQEDSAHSMLLDEDSIWIGGMGGLERFKDAILLPLLPNASPGIWEQCVERDETQWFIDSRNSLYFRTAWAKLHRIGANTEALFCSASGDLARDQKGLIALEHGHVSHLPILPFLKGYSNHYIFTGAVRTADGAIIAAAAGGAIGRSLWEYHSGRWRQLLPIQSLPEITSMCPLPNNEVRLGFRDGSVGQLTADGGRIILTGRTGLGAIVGFATTTYGTFAYGSKGIALDRGGTFVSPSFAQPEMIARASGLVEASNGDLWLNGGKGIVRVSARELSMMIRDPEYKGVANNVSEGDYTGPSAPSLFSDSVQIGADGRVWFSTLNGIVSVRPVDVEPTAAPALLIKDFLADGQPSSSSRSFPPGIGSLTIKYVGIDFTDPTGVSYEYKLDGYDQDWQRVGARTEAIYTHLRAGRYIFKVKARNGFGTWTDPVVLDPFTVLPHIYEERWFLVASILLLSCLVGFVIRFRLQGAAAKIRRHAEERADERIAIARDLHDTLLQGVQGLLMTFHSATESVPVDHESRPMLDRALNSAEKLIIEGRDRVKGLRGVQVSGEQLGFLFETVAEELGCREKLFVQVSLHSAATMLKERVASEVYLIGREALINAVRHANASRISLKLRFAPNRFSLECQDDGKGFDLGALESTDGSARWGIRGMRERVDKLGGSLQVQSRPGGGTSIRLSIEGSDTYQ